MTNPFWQQAIDKFSRSIKEKLAGTIIDVRLFGSVAKGTDTQESDIDILVLVEKDVRITNDIIMDITVDINLDYDVVISPTIMTNLRYANPIFRETAFYHALEHGISL